MMKTYTCFTRKTAALFCFWLLISTCLFSQRVKRKGTQPIDISKQKRPGANVKAFTMAQLAGKWQEISRDSKTNISISFTDTIFLNFIDSNTVLTKQGNETSMKGEAAIDASSNELIAAADVYTIVSVTDSVLVLDNQENILHMLKKTDQFFYETFGKKKTISDHYKEPISVKLADIKGKWVVYKREAKPGTVNPPSTIINNVNILNITGENIATGEITFYQSEKSEMLPCTIKLTNAGFEVRADKYNWSFFVYKLDKNELVFGETDVLLYFAKRM